MEHLMMISANAETWAWSTVEQAATAIAEQDAFNVRFFGTGELLGAYGPGDATQARKVAVRGGATAVR